MWRCYKSDNELHKLTFVLKCGIFKFGFKKKESDKYLHKEYVKPGLSLDAESFPRPQQSR